MTTIAPITAEVFEARFDNGEDINACFDWSKARRPNQEPREVNVDFPAWVVQRRGRWARRGSR